MGIGMKYPQLEHQIISGVYERVVKGCQTDKCREIAKKILQSNSVEDAMVDAVTAVIVDVTNNGEEKARKIARSCVNKNLILWLHLAVFIDDDFYIENAVSDAIEACVLQHLANEKSKSMKNRRP